MDWLARDRAWWPLWGVLGAALVVAACEDPSHLFTGRWEAEGAEGSTLLPGVPVAAIGHYGTHVTGIVFYHVPGGSDPVAACPCGYIDHVGLDVDRRFVAFNTTCEDGTQEKLYWELQTEEDKETKLVSLVGLVRASDGGGPEQGVALVRKTRALNDEDYVCEVP
jgi:hypothetical protein